MYKLNHKNSYLRDGRKRNFCFRLNTFRKRQINKQFVPVFAFSRLLLWNTMWKHAIAAASHGWTPAIWTINRTDEGIRKIVQLKIRGNLIWIDLICCLFVILTVQMLSYKRHHIITIRFTMNVCESLPVVFASVLQYVRAIIVVRNFRLFTRVTVCLLYVRYNKSKRT